MSQVLALREEANRELRDARLIIDSPKSDPKDVARANALIDSSNLKKARAKVIEMSPAPDPIAAAPEVTHGMESRYLRASMAEEINLLRAHTVARPNMAADVEAEWTRRSTFMPQAAGSTAPAAGGYSIGPAFLAELLIAMKAQGGMRAASHCFTTETGASLTYPVLDDRASTGRLLTAENVQLAAAADLPFTAPGQLGAYTFVSDVALVSVQLMQDSAFDFGALLAAALASRLARTENPYFTSGTGVGQPRGVLLDAPVGVTGATGSATSVTADNTLDLIASVDPAYRPGAVFMMHDTTLQVYRKIKDPSGRYLHDFNGDPTSNGAPVDRIAGYPVVINQDMPQMAAGATPVLFGNFAAGYKIRTVVDLRVQVLRERYIESFQVGFIASIRSDGRMVSGAAPIKAYRNSAS